MREPLLSAALLIALAISGCATEPASAPILTDRIYAVAPVNPQSARALGVNYPNPIAVLGEKHTYIVGLGSEDIIRLANMPGDKPILKDTKSLYLDGNRIWGSIGYGITGSYSTNFQVAGVAIDPAPLKGGDVQSGGRFVNFYQRSTPGQSASPGRSAAVSVVTAPLLAGAFLMWAVVDLTAAATGAH